MGKEIEIQTKGEMEIINNRKAKIDAESKTKELEAMIQDLYNRLEAVEENK
jgi:hypothetical protein